MHKFNATVTNLGHLIPTCSCGWFGVALVVPQRGIAREAALAALELQHLDHVFEVASTADAIR